MKWFCMGMKNASDICFELENLQSRIDVMERTFLNKYARRKVSTSIQTKIRFLEESIFGDRSLKEQNLDELD